MKLESKFGKWAREYTIMKSNDYFCMLYNHNKRYIPYTLEKKNSKKEMSRHAHLKQKIEKEM